ncbi:hypothetical protein GOBAR_AA20144 [Gossypium barbadense]|uniref:Uncharacterized protein n=1 Tax=Gossypium barbadense TaxID=3634 RepID=A0A2P5XB20_GOSBA|nr:hypothetical protein GOBAR_AA20144 [Gossypium barbadense]
MLRLESMRVLTILFKKLCVSPSGRGTRLRIPGTEDGAVSLLNLWVRANKRSVPAGCIRATWFGHTVGCRSSCGAAQQIRTIE